MRRSAMLSAVAWAKSLLLRSWRGVQSALSRQLALGGQRSSGIAKLPPSRFSELISEDEFHCNQIV